MIIKQIEFQFNLFFYRTKKVTVIPMHLIDELLIPSIVPRKPLQIVSSIMIFSFVPARTLGSAFTSSTADAIAACAALPITESNITIAPIVTEVGLDGKLAF